MKQRIAQFKRIVTSFVAVVVFPTLVAAQMTGDAAHLEELYERLQDPELNNWESVEQEIWSEWARSGSPSIDLLYSRGQEALQADDAKAAVEHFSAAIDHAPDFAEAYNGRATAFFQMERFGLSLSDIEMTLALNPRHFGAMTGLGLILEALDRKADALSAYRAVTAIHPHSPNVQESIEKLEAQLEGQAL